MSEAAEGTFYVSGIVNEKPCMKALSGEPVPWGGMITISPAQSQGEAKQP